LAQDLVLARIAGRSPSWLGCLHWVAEHSLPPSALADEDTILDVLRAIACKLGRTRAAANTIVGKRAICARICRKLRHPPRTTCSAHLVDL